MTDQLRMKMMRLLEEMTLQLDEFERLSSPGYGEERSSRAKTIHGVLMTFQPKVLEIASEMGCPVRTFERKK